MFQLFTFLLAFSAAGSVTAAPSRFSKRIAQVISQSTSQWQTACDEAGGGPKCNQLAVTAFSTLLAGAGPCDQQDSADNMMTLAKQLNSSPMISLTQIFVQQARNSPDSLSVPYCQNAPKNSELNGLFQCQFQGVNPKIFFGNAQVGAQGTIPLGQTAPLNPPGSCPAHPSGPIADGTQLVNQVSSPGVPSGSGGNDGTQSSASSQASSSPTPVSSCTTSSSPASTPIASPSSGDFHAQNGKDAQTLNQMFQTLTPNSPCTAGQQACVQGQFAQCVNAQFVLTQCAGATQCMALPLVNKRGTSIACDSQSDANARISAALNS
ncbi:hypothetical protein BGW80DRAFT_1437194 [Lactifluus volemus]|nr:hypothetical protein BGW80DRAFT_1437194 [Lactifluus volemus]